MPPEYVVDTSVALRWFLPDQDQNGDAARMLALILAGDIAAVAPRNLMYEFCGTLSQQYRRKRKTVAQAMRALSDFWRIPIRYVESSKTMERAVSLSFTYRKNFYDMCFFAIGEHEGIPVCTGDEKSLGGLPADFPCRYVLLRDFLSGQ